MSSKDPIHQLNQQLQAQGTVSVEGGSLGIDRPSGHSRFTPGGPTATTHHTILGIDDAKHASFDTNLMAGNHARSSTRTPTHTVSSIKTEFNTPSISDGKKVAPSPSENEPEVQRALDLVLTKVKEAHPVTDQELSFARSHATTVKKLLQFGIEEGRFSADFPKRVQEVVYSTPDVYSTYKIAPEHAVAGNDSPIEPSDEPPSPSRDAASAFALLASMADASGNPGSGDLLRRVFGQVLDARTEPTVTHASSDASRPTPRHAPRRLQGCSTAPPPSTSR